MATIKDVAEKAGVTVTTVSRVLNNRGYISEETREKVYRVMREMQYQPNEIARSLSRKKTMILGMIIPTIAHPFFAELTNYIEKHASKLGYKILLCNSRMDQGKEKEYIDMLTSNRVDGMFMSSHTLEVDEYKKLKQPIITFDRRIADIPYVSSENEQGGIYAAELLLKKGCRRIAHITGNLGLDLLSNQRTNGFVESLRGRGVEPIVFELGPDVFDSEGYERVITELLEQYPDIDGIFASGDILAMNVIKVCMSKGIDIPGRIKLIGYDDIEMASLVSPALTTIRQPLEEIAKRAVQLLDGLIRGEEVQHDNVLPVTLIERSTT
ncbi:LacI family DNA-binding transcriptional regulator [Paenibacillus vini]|uniref:LacI family DNA-binding transcriptional regulator n=1 Tax=Paenibacillus vini TaxID=1476024 RepID=UPI0025B634D3|nr:LacI family DNA-binding transcriptional regulator [Paenibacillus vini]MDN4067877.1 LacI family DNA-binding transcriptional regulator [Paenibacillus vini]